MYSKYNKFGGNVYERDLNSIFLKNAEKYKMNYSHNKPNRWNLWEQDSGLVISFTLNNGLFIPALVGIKKKPLEKFYSSNGANVDSWVKHHIDEYYSTLKSILEDTEQQTIENKEEVKKLVNKRKSKKQISCNGQLTFDDIYGKGNW